jgi:Quercetinase C-terminal cupin domain
LSLTASDGVAISDESSLTIRADSDTEVMLFDLA